MMLKKVREIDYSKFIKMYLEKDIKPSSMWNKYHVLAGMGHYCIHTLRGMYKSKYLKEISFLDVGCKEGWLDTFFRASYPEVDYLGIDVSNSFVEYARDWERSVINMDVCDMSFNNDAFTVVFARQMLNQVYDIKVAVNEMMRVLKPMGILVINNTIPSVRSKNHYWEIENEKDIINCIDSKYKFLTRDCGKEENWTESIITLEKL